MMRPEPEDRALLAAAGRLGSNDQAVTDSCHTPARPFSTIRPAASGTAALAEDSPHHGGCRRPDIARPGQMSAPTRTSRRSGAVVSRL